MAAAYSRRVGCARRQRRGVRRGAGDELGSDRFLELFFSSPWCGATFAPLNVRWSVAENEFAMRDAGAKILFDDDHFIAETRKLNEDGIRIQRPDGSEAAAGEIDEILIRGDNVMTRYLDNAQATKESLANGWMHSGDAGFVDEDGFMYVADRMKDMIVTGGVNVYSVDVERALYQHPAVREVAVIGIPSQPWGEAVHAVVVLKEGVAATEAQLIAHCRSLIGGYKCPRSIEFRTDLLPIV